MPQIAAYFKHLHHMTGSNVLIIAPSVGAIIDGSAKPPTEEILKIFESRIYRGRRGDVGQNAGREIDTFVTTLTSETYKLTEFLGVKASDLPCMLFFEKLLFPLEFVRWDLSGKTASAIVAEMQHIMHDLHEQCDLDGEIPSRLATTQELLVGIEQLVTTAMAQKADVLRAHLNRQSDTLRYLTSLARLKEQCEILSASGQDEQLDMLRRNLDWLGSEPDNQMWIKFLRRLRRKWSCTSTASFTEAFDHFLSGAPMAKTLPGEWTTTGRTIRDHIEFAKRSIEETDLNLKQHLVFAESAPAAERQKLLKELEDVRLDSEKLKSPLSVLRSHGMIDGKNARKPVELSRKAPLAELFEYLSCFISYSTRDADFAERLYSDLEKAGVKCWFAPEDIRIGDKFRQEIDKSIKAKKNLLRKRLTNPG